MACALMFVYLLVLGWIYANPTTTSRGEEPMIIANSNEDMGPIEASIRKKILQQFRPMYLDVINQSVMYGEPESSEKFFCIIVVSTAFTGSNTYQRHLCINALIQDEVLKNKIDGITIVCLVETV
ncbi:bolA-like protein DDB_G0274169 isoform X3 [Macrosteles quadrilineatus]|uniref:bolA-like protein DDB_G0274169 isoform X3 n=1 Tax=Macrosteles quadrilineatus TaxID=74068 RepID=UPI0023E2D6E6|nr:bolA-like protein DDB_G0274169 isoform X3 [Macrosteles quadrilineatus]